MDEPPLFDLPRPLRLPPKMAASPAAPRYSRFKPTGRWLCDDCTRAIHEQGIERAPFPSRARWRRTDRDGGTLHLCDRHKNERLADDAS